MMCVYSAEGKGLVRHLDRLFERLGDEEPIVSMIMTNGDPMLLGMPLKRSLGPWPFFDAAASVCL